MTSLRTFSPTAKLCYCYD